MPDLHAEVVDTLPKLRAAKTDLTTVEVKAAVGGLPKSVVETVSAFSNTDGGLILLGLDETTGFFALDVDAGKLASDLASACADQIEPPIRPEIEIVEIEGRSVVAALVEPLPPTHKPCFIRTRGIERGSFVRTFDGDRTLSTYEVHVLQSSRGQPGDDTIVVEQATVGDLDPALTDALVRRLRSTRGQTFASASDEEVLDMMGVTVNRDGIRGVTLAGLLALGRFPQQFLPQLDVTFVVFPTTSGEPLQDGTRFLDNQSIDGPIPRMVAETLAAMRRNMKRRSIVLGLGREDRWEYPEEAIRELIANALMHRDYHPLAHGTQVRVSLYPDRLEVSSPGGLHGPVSRDDLLAEPVSSSRNARLAKLLEDVEIESTNRTVCENRGSGLLATAAALRDAGMEPPQVIDAVREFRMVIKNHGLLDDEAVAWLSTIDTARLNDRQRLALAFLRRNSRITNQNYRSVTGTDSLTATRELTGLAAEGLIEKRSDRRWTVWVLAGAEDQSQLDLDSESVSGSRTDRRAAIRALLRPGARSTLELADQLKISRQGVLRWLRQMEADGEVEPTSDRRRSRHNRWRLRDGVD
ncbi:MAG: ATP-binding protein [Thermoleophilia bacterium]